MAKFLRRISGDYNTGRRGFFMANMSHEIRTPMNAIVGLSEILIRRSKDPEEKEYLSAMETATQSLLMTINNILDYESILDGDIAINDEEFCLSDLLSDVINIERINLNTSKIRFIPDIDPNIPKIVKGDATRIKQVLVHLLANANRFIRDGYICLRVASNVENDISKLEFSVQNTGKGISKEVLDAVFGCASSEEASLKNKDDDVSIGLVIARSILEKMGSNLECDTDENKGSSFSFTMNLPVVEKTDERNVFPGYCHVAVFLNDKREEKNAVTMLRSLEVSNVVLSSMGETFLAHSKKKISHLIIEYDKYIQIREIRELNDMGITYVVLIDSIKQAQSASNTVYVKKPLWYREMVKVFKGEGIRGADGFTELKETVLAVGARILIVDDNDINVKVTKGLLKPYGVTVDTASSGEEGIELIKKNKYDIVYMDHMMPGMDGTEVAKKIRSIDDPFYKSLPIIALTANTNEGIEETYRMAGMNDYVPKPVDGITLEESLKKWLPKDMITVSFSEITKGRSDTDIFNHFKVIDVSTGLGYTGGNSDMYLSVVKEFASSIEEKKVLLENLVTSEDVGRFTIEVHGLKSSAKTIGALGLSEKALEMERLGHIRDIDSIKNRMDHLLCELDAVITDLKPLMAEEEVTVEKRPVERDKARELLRQLFYSSADFDYDRSKEIVASLGEYSFGGKLEKVYIRMRDCIEDINYEETKKCALEMIAHI